MMTMRGIGWTPHIKRVRLTDLGLLAWYCCYYTHLDNKNLILKLNNVVGWARPKWALTLLSSPILVLLMGLLFGPNKTLKSCNFLNLFDYKDETPGLGRPMFLMSSFNINQNIDKENQVNEVIVQKYIKIKCQW